MRLIIDSSGEEIVSRDLVGIAGRTVDAEPAMVAILDQIRAAEREQFASRGQSGSGGWAPLAGGGEATLRDTDALFEALTGETADSVAITSRTGADYGTTLPYAIRHQTGTSRMPQRRPVQLPDRVRRDIVRTLQNFVMTGAVR